MLQPRSHFLACCCLAACAMGLAGTVRGNVNSDPRHYVARGDELAKAERWQDALAQYTLASQLDPRLADAYAGRARVQAQLKNRELALADVAEAIGVDRRCADAYIVRAELNREANNTAQALIDLNRAIEVQRKHPRALLLRGQLQLQRQQYAEAVNDLTLHLAQVNPKDATAYFQRGLAFFKAGDNFEASLADLNKSLELDPKNAESLTVRAEVHEARNRPAEALADYERALALKPGDPAIHLKRGGFHYNQKHWKECVADLSIAIKANEKNTAALYKRAFAYLQSNRAKEAAADFEHALALLESNQNSSDYRNALFGHASAVSRLGEWERAIKVFTKAIELNPRDYISLTRRGDCYRRLDKPAEALADFDRAIVVFPAYQHAYTHRASLHLSQGKLDEARADYEQVVRIYAGGARPADTTLAYSKVLAEVFAGRFDDGVKLAESLVKEHAGDNEWLYDMACAYAIAAEVALRDKDDKKTAKEKKERSDRLARRAFEVLEKAVEAGYDDFDHMRSDPDFNFINKDARFQKIGATG